MLDLSRDIHSLTDFKKSTFEFANQLKQTGEPVVRTTTVRPSWSFRTQPLIRSFARWPKKRVCSKASARALSP
jgi:hypothetical protein